MTSSLSKFLCQSPPFSSYVKRFHLECDAGMNKNFKAPMLIESIANSSSLPHGVSSRGRSNWDDDILTHPEHEVCEQVFLNPKSSKTTLVFKMYLLVHGGLERQLSV